VQLVLYNCGGLIRAVEKEHSPKPTSAAKGNESKTWFRGRKGTDWLITSPGEPTILYELIKNNDAARAALLAQCKQVEAVGVKMRTSEVLIINAKRRGSCML
jgi:hypothetical protein